MKKLEPKNITLEQLAKYRSQKGLTIQQVAAQMHVSLPIVEHIENNAFENIGAAPFIRGHVSNYCKCLGLEADALLSQIPGNLLQHKNVQRPDAFLPASVSKVMLKTNHYGRYAFGTGVLAVLAVSAFFVWDKWGLVSGADSTLTAQNDQETVTYSSILPPVQKVDAISDETLQAQDTDLHEVEVPVESDSVDSGNVDSVNVDSERETQTADEVVPADSNEINEVGEQLMAEAAAYVIEFELQEQAWVSIKTESGDKVIHDLIGPGLRRYESDQPMSMRIGNADKLTMSINGEVIDLTPHSNKNLAKFEWPLEG